MEWLIIATLETAGHVSKLRHNTDLMFILRLLYLVEDFDFQFIGESLNTKREEINLTI